MKNLKEEGDLVLSDLQITIAPENVEITILAFCVNNETLVVNFHALPSFLNLICVASKRSRSDRVGFCIRLPYALLEHA